MLISLPLLQDVHPTKKHTIKLMGSLRIKRCHGLTTPLEGSNGRIEQRGVEAGLQQHCIGLKPALQILHFSILLLNSTPVRSGTLLIRSQLFLIVRDALAGEKQLCLRHTLGRNRTQSQQEKSRTLPSKKTQVRLETNLNITMSKKGKESTSMKRTCASSRLAGVPSGAI